MVRLSTLNPLTSILVNKYISTCGGNGIGVVVVTGSNHGSNGVVVVMTIMEFKDLSSSATSYSWH